MTATVRIPTHTVHAHNGHDFATDLSVSARAGLTGGLTLGPDPAVAAEIAYRRERLAARRARRVTRDGDDGNPGARRRGTVTRWISWLQSAPRRRSSAAHAS
jgi:hypothetical protein